MAEPTESISPTASWIPQPKFAGSTRNFSIPQKESKSKQLTSSLQDSVLPIKKIIDNVHRRPKKSKTKDEPVVVTSSQPRKFLHVLNLELASENDLSNMKKNRPTNNVSIFSNRRQKHSDLSSVSSGKSNKSDSSDQSESSASRGSVALKNPVFYQCTPSLYIKPKNDYQLPPLQQKKIFIVEETMQMKTKTSIQNSTRKFPDMVSTILPYGSSIGSYKRPRRFEGISQKTKGLNTIAGKFSQNENSSIEDEKSSFGDQIFVADDDIGSNKSPETNEEGSHTLINENVKNVVGTGKKDEVEVSDLQIN